MRFNIPSLPPGPATWIREGWSRLHRLPGGKRLFDRLLGAAIPYTGSLGAHILTISPGHSRVELKERHAIRNHLQSVHAIALANLGELTGNLALIATLPDDARFIVKSLSIDFEKKARGVLTAECKCTPIVSNEKQEVPLEVQIHDASGDRVARVGLVTLVGPLRKKQE